MMVKRGNGLILPHITDATCIGCGACVLPCPAEPKALVVHPFTVHTTAKLPEHRPVAIPKASDDFPF